LPDLRPDHRALPAPSPYNWRSDNHQHQPSR